MKELLTTVASRLEERVKEQEEQLVHELYRNTHARAKSGLLCALFHAQESIQHLLTPAGGDDAACTEAPPPPNPDDGSCHGGSSRGSDSALGKVSPQAQHALNCLDAQVAALTDTLRLGAVRSGLLAAGASASTAALAVSTSSGRGASASAVRAATSSGAASAAGGGSGQWLSAFPRGAASLVGLNARMLPAGPHARAAAAPGVAPWHTGGPGPESDFPPGVVEGGAVGMAASDFARRIVADSSSPEIPHTMEAFAAWWGERIHELALLRHQWSTGAVNTGQLAQHLSMMAVRLSALLLARPWGPAVFSMNLETCTPEDPPPASYDRAARAMAPTGAQPMAFQLLQSWWEAAAERLTAARRNAAQRALADPSSISRQEAAVATLERLQSSYLVHVSALCVVALSAFTSPEQLAAVYLTAWPHMPSMVGLYESVLRLYPPGAPAAAPPAPQAERR